MMGIVGWVNDGEEWGVGGKGNVGGTWEEREEERRRGGSSGSAEGKAEAQRATQH